MTWNHTWLWHFLRRNKKGLLGLLGHAYSAHIQASSEHLPINQGWPESHVNVLFMLFIGPYYVSLSSLFVDQTPPTHTHSVCVCDTKRVQKHPSPWNSQRMKRPLLQIARVFITVPWWICPILTEKNGEGTCQSMRRNGVTWFSHCLKGTPITSTTRSSVWNSLTEDNRAASWRK